MERARKGQTEIWLAGALPGLKLARWIGRFPYPGLIGAQTARIPVEFKRWQLDRFFLRPFVFIFLRRAGTGETEKKYKYPNGCAHKCPNLASADILAASVELVDSE